MKLQKLAEFFLLALGLDVHGIYQALDAAFLSLQPPGEKFGLRDSCLILVCLGEVLETIK